MDDPQGIVGCARGTRQAGRGWAAALGVAVLFYAANLSADDRLVSWLQEALPEDAPPSWTAPGRVIYPEGDWSVFSRVTRASAFDWTAAAELPPPPPPMPPQLQSSRRGFQLVSRQQPDPNAPPPPPAPPQAPSTGGSDDQSSDGQASDAPSDQQQQPSDQQQKPIGKEPENNTMLFLRTQDVLLKQGQWQADMGINYTLFQTPIPLAAVNGGGNVVDVLPGTINRRLLYSPFAVRYGWTDDVQLFAVLPVGYTDTQVSGPNLSLMSNSGGAGDLNFGFSYHLMRAECDRPDGILSWAATAPTGEYTSPVALGAVIPNFALGQGFWALSGQMLFVNRYDPVTVYYGAGCRHLFQRRFDGTMVTAGEQISYQFGVGFAVNDRVTLSTTLQGFYITNTQIDGVTARGSNLEPISLRFAATIARRCRILEPFALIGMTQTAPAASVGITWTFY